MRFARGGRAILLGGSAVMAAVAACSTSASLPFGENFGGAVPPGGVAFWGRGTTDLTVSDVVRPNTCVPLLDASAALANVAIPAFAPGTRVLLLQAQGTLEAGHFELARVADVAGATLTLDHALANTFASDATRTAQICDVPEFATVEIGSAQTLAASPWLTGAGGVVAISARRMRVQSGGAIDASGIGFAGGACSAPLPIDSNIGPSDPTTAGYAGAKGEGIDPASIALIGRAPGANAGGGGNANQAGGGGGANAGAGGAGGLAASPANPDIAAGVGGSAVVDAGTLLLMGGGGGGGQRRVNDAVDGGNCGGGWGGGIVFVLASSLEGGGTIAARGGIAGDPSPGGGGAGGGAGGTLFVLARQFGGFSGVFDARGGAGGNAVVGTAGTGGPGGGGGGGRVFVNGAVTVALDGGAPGMTVGTNLGAHGATAGGAGTSSSSAIP